MKSAACFIVEFCIQSYIYILCTCNNFPHYLHVAQLRALYLGDNDFEKLPAEIGEFKNLQVVCMYMYLCLYRFVQCRNCHILNI